ncbi:MAG: hypothetical protein JOZ42_05075 [Acetobacteraceae bacterium]|nr:hypothetical protein [Acetobacteraceae bacterium]
MSGTTPFPLGVYVGNPNGNDQAANAQFEAAFDQFSHDLGARPAFMDAYTDNAFGDPSTWAGNAGWSAWSWAQTGSNYVGPGSGVVPVVGVPMSWAGADGSNVDAAYRALASGAYDADIKAVADAWFDQGYTTVQFRLGYEFNIPSISWDVLDASAPSAAADFVAAFRRMASDIHAEAAARGVTAQIVWNPGSWTSGNTTQLYPGDQYVDITSLDLYSPTWTGDFTDWADGGTQQVDPTAWASNPVNREHFWNWTNATAQDPTPGLSAPGWSMQDAIQFAREHGKPLSISETGAGNAPSSPASYGPVDDPDFVRWLSGTLAAAEQQGVTIQNVDIWDTGNSYFSNGTRAQEAAAWNQYFGAGTATPPPPPNNPSTVTIGSGPDTLALQVSEDAWNGDAQFTIAVDGVQIGGTQTATASHAAGQSQTFNVLGSFGPGTHAARVDFLNDAYGGSSSTDRNLYVTAATADGVTVPGAVLNEYSGGAQSFSFSLPGGSSPPPPVSIGSGPDTLALQVSEDAWNGDAQFTVAVDGQQIGGTETATASHASGQTQLLNVLGSFAAGSHTVTVDFLNDAWGGTSATDRNLYVTGASINGTAVPGATLSEYSGGPQSFGFSVLAGTGS